MDKPRFVPLNIVGRYKVKFMPDQEQPVKPIKPPFRYFGGKRHVADLVWAGLGNVAHYIEPFFGSGAVLLSRPHKPRRETINDIDGLVANFWRAVKAEPDAVAVHANHPRVEIDLFSRSAYLATIRDSLTEKLMGDPRYYDTEVAGWWVWAMCMGIYPLRFNGPWVLKDGKAVRDRRGRGAEVSAIDPKPSGVAAFSLGTGEEKQEKLTQWMRSLASRLENTAVLCGDWKRACRKAAIISRLPCGIFLDPPYDTQSGRDRKIYPYEMQSSREVVEWAIHHGKHEGVRIVLAEFDTHTKMPNDWSCREIPSPVRTSPELRDKHRLWFSPHCLITQKLLF